MLIITNRLVGSGNSSTRLSAKFQPMGTDLSFVTATRNGDAMSVTGSGARADDAQLLQALLPVFQQGRPVLLYVHGFNNPPAVSIERCARLSEIYGVEVIGFSWPSEGKLADGSDQPNLPPGSDQDGADDDDIADVRQDQRSEGWVQRKIRRYRQAKVNAQDCTDALARCLRLVATARLYANQQPVSVAVHSLGGHLLQYTLELSGVTESLGSTHNVALLAACCRSTGHETWVSKIRPKGQVFITYNKNDTVLLGATIADGGQAKLGLEPGPRLVSPQVRYVSFTNAPMEAGGHRYFVAKRGKNVKPKAQKLFARVFGSKRDLEPGQSPKDVYPMNCDPDGATCYMANDLPSGEGG